MPENVLRFRRLGFAFLLIVSALLLRWPSLHRQIWNLDEGSTLTMAQMVLAGQVPYLEAADNRTPLVPYAKALILAVTGDWNTRAMHGGVALMLGLTAILLWQTARQLGQEPAGVIAAIVFTWLSVGMIPAIDAMTAHTGWFVVFFSSLGFWLFSCALVRDSGWTALASGAAFGLSCLAKQPGLLDFGVCLVILVLMAGFDPGPRARLGRLGSALVIGLTLPLVATLAYFYAHGALDDLIFYAWTYNTKYYVPEVPLGERLMAIRVPFELLLTRMPVILVLGVVAAVVLLRKALDSLRLKSVGASVLSWLILGWTAAGLLSTMLSGRDFGHYSIQVIPGLSLACGWLLVRVHEKSLTWRDTGQTGRWRAAQVAAGLALASIVLPTVVWLRELETSDGQSAEVGRLVQTHSRPEDRIFVWGYMPEMHVYARRLPSTRFFYTNWVTGLIPWTNLDWMKDTAYAIIPGTPEQMRRDFELRPPMVIVDTGPARGYLKYPIKAQSWLWSKIEHEFAEVAPDYTHPRGFRVYQRIADAPYGARFPDNLPVNTGVQITVSAQTRPETIPIRVNYPAGTTAVELYKDEELYRRIECPPDQPGTVVFFALGTDLPTGERQLQALTRGRHTLASSPRTFLVNPAIQSPLPSGPALEYNKQALPPLEATTFNGGMYLIPNSNRWDAHAPAKLVYERPPGLHTLELEFGVNDALYQQPEKWKTDGVDVVVELASTSGKLHRLYSRHLNAQVNGSDRGLQKARVLLPLNEPGRIILSISPGNLSDISSDVAYWKSVRGAGAPGGLFFRDQRINATQLELTYGIEPLYLEGSNVIMVHAPSRLDFPLQKGMHRLTGTLGLHPNAWTGTKKSAGAVFEFWHVPTTGAPTLMHHFEADPGHNPAHRPAQPFSVNLPYPTEGLLRLVTRPAHPQDNAFNYTYWGPLIAEEFSAAIQTGSQPVRSILAETTFGFTDMEEAKRPVLFAHAPSRLDFPLPPDQRRLTGAIGLLAAAHDGPDATAGGLFIVEVADAADRRTVVWQRELNPRDVPADRGFIPFSVDLPHQVFERLILRTEARPGQPLVRAWTFWHNLRLE